MNNSNFNWNFTKWNWKFTNYLWKWCSEKLVTHIEWNYPFSNDTYPTVRCYIHNHRHLNSNLSYEIKLRIEYIKRNPNENRTINSPFPIELNWSQVDSRFPLVSLLKNEVDLLFLLKIIYREKCTIMNILCFFLFCFRLELYICRNSITTATRRVTFKCVPSIFWLLILFAAVCHLLPLTGSFRFPDYPYPTVVISTRSRTANPAVTSSSSSFP